MLTLSHLIDRLSIKHERLLPIWYKEGDKLHNLLFQLMMKTWNHAQPVSFLTTIFATTSPSWQSQPTSMLILFHIHPFSTPTTLLPFSSSWQSQPRFLAILSDSNTLFFLLSTLTITSHNHSHLSQLTHQILHLLLPRTITTKNYAHPVSQKTSLIIMFILFHLTNRASTLLWNKTITNDLIISRHTHQSSLILLHLTFTSFHVHLLSSCIIWHIAHFNSSPTWQSQPNNHTLMSQITHHLLHLLSCLTIPLMPILSPLQTTHSTSPPLQPLPNCSLPPVHLLTAPKPDCQTCYSQGGRGLWLGIEFLLGGERA